MLGPQALSEEPEVTAKRESLNQSMLSNAQQLASCRLLLLRTHEAIDVLLKRQQQAITSELLAKTSNLLQNIKNVILDPVQIFRATIEFLQAKGGLENILQNAPLLSSLMVFSLLLTLLLKRSTKASLKRQATSDQQGYLSQFQISLISFSDLKGFGIGVQKD